MISTIKCQLFIIFKMMSSKEGFVQIFLDIIYMPNLIVMDAC